MQIRFHWKRSTSYQQCVHTCTEEVRPKYVIFSKQYLGYVPTISDYFSLRSRNCSGIMGTLRYRSGVYQLCVPTAPVYRCSFCCCILKIIGLRHQCNDTIPVPIIPDSIFKQSGMQRTTITCGALWWAIRYINHSDRHFVSGNSWRLSDTEWKVIRYSGNAALDKRKRLFTYTQQPSEFPAAVGNCHRDCRRTC